MGNFSKSKMYCLCTRCIIVNSVQVHSELKESLMTLSTRLWKLPKSTSKKQNIYNILLINRDIHFTCILCLLNNTCVQHNFKSAHVSNLFCIQSDLFWHRCLERQTFGTPRMYTLSLSKSIKRSNYGEFLKVKNVLFMYTITRCSLKMSKNMNKRATENYILF
jgi:hypothetical protein